MKAIPFSLPVKSGDAHWDGSRWTYPVDAIFQTDTKHECSAHVFSVTVPHSIRLGANFVKKCNILDSEPEKVKDYVVTAVNEWEALIALESVSSDIAIALGKIPAFGDTIGTEINKAQLGMLHRELKRAIENLQTLRATQTK